MITCRRRLATATQSVSLFGGNTMLTFERIEAQLDGTALNISRAKVPGGWLVFIIHVTVFSGQGGIAFVHDPSHTWDGSSLPSTRS